jgi:acetyl-CoA synthetase
MPMVPELAIAMLACARIGAPHSVIFGGFSADAVRDRVNDCESKLVITADGGYRRGSVLHLKKIVDEALEGTKTVENVVVLNRVTGSEVSMKGGRDHWWTDVVQGRRTSVPPSTWTRRTCCTCSTRAAPPASRRVPCTRPAVT